VYSLVTRGKKPPVAQAAGGIDMPLPETDAPHTKPAQNETTDGKKQNADNSQEVK